MPNPNPPIPEKPLERREMPAVRAARTVALEDLRPGDFVAVRQADAQLYPFETGYGIEPPRHADLLAFIPEEAGLPRKVVSVGPPFLLVKKPSGHHDTIDVRLTRLLRLDQAYAKEAFEKLDPQYLTRQRAAEAKRKAKAKKRAKAEKKRDKKNAGKKKRGR